MPFLSEIFVIASPSVVKKCQSLQSPYLHFIDERKFITSNKPETYGLTGFEHASFNFILRTSIICSNWGLENLSRDFIVMDDDNIPLTDISLEMFSSDNKYTGYYYQRFCHILPEKFQLRSYDVSLVMTRKMLADKGISNGFVFSSHMPQIINRDIFIKACNYFDTAKYDYLICDWSMYFNYAIKFFSNMFQQQPAPVICWPMNTRLAAVSLLAREPLFENFYPENYTQKGIFYNLTRFASPSNKEQTHHHAKKTIFLEHYPPKQGIHKLLHHLTLGLANILLSRKIIKIFYVFWKEDRKFTNPLKRAAIYWKFIHSTSYIQAMCSRRWYHPGSLTQIVGLFDYPSGLGTSAQHLTKTMQKTGDGIIRQVNISGYFRYPGVFSPSKERIISAKGGTVIFMLAPPQACRILHDQDFSHIQHKKLINYVWFETNTIPADWQKSLTYFNEIWVNNDYIQKLFTPLCTKLKIPVKTRPFIPQFAEPVCMEGIFSPNKVSILMVFNINSGWYRKNPLALIKAYSMLPSHAAQRSELIIKTSSSSNHRHYKKLATLAKKYGFTLIGKRYSNREMSGLLQGCNIYASLHRAEGLGLLPLQAMSYGKAVLATGWSGNMSYMTQEANMLVSYSLYQNNKKLKPHFTDMVVSDRLIFKEHVEYAEPDIQHASTLLESLIMEDELRSEKGMRGRIRYNNYIESIHKLWKEIPLTTPAICEQP